MNEENLSNVNSKLESGKAHARQAFDTASEAARVAGETIKQHAQNVYDTGREQFGAAARDIGDAATAKYSELREQAVRFAHDYRNRAQDLQGDAENYVREHPWQAMGIAAGVGLVLGILISRR